MSVLDAARTALRQGNKDKALMLARKAVAKAGEDTAAWILLGFALAANDLWDEAIETLQRATDRTPDSAELRFELARTAYQARRLDIAEAAYRKVLALLPKNIAAYCNLGVVYSVQGRLANAEDCYRDALKYCPAELRGGIAYNLGEVLRRQGKPEDAIAALQDAVAAEPGLYVAHNALAGTLFDLKRMAESIAAYRKAIAADAGRPEPRYKLSQALLAEGRLAEAEDEMRGYLSQRPETSSAYEALGRILILQERQGELAGVLEDWERNLPGDHRLEHARAAWSFQAAPARASDGYVRQVFDGFAENFDATLKKLDYRAPQALVEALHETGDMGEGKADILDAGCGTGLCGPLLRPLAKRLVGVDLSAGMLAKAGELGIYDALHEAELGDYLQRQAGAFDVVLSADTLVYFGDLKPVIAAAAAVLRPGGRLLFSLEHAADAEPEPVYRLNAHGRYSHTQAHVAEALNAAGLGLLCLRHEVFRKEAGQPVPGLLVVASK
ncbi:tetratricopeptide repeat protein [Methylococcus sp. EFPC2]|uniref:tetratricopeptide repeat protein n=1 Tax=Methylococcus sp. EFPC2 TaxID=2812648 RepID=UPI001968466E|nr:tetratricopeptide repeat protein [Methylococcus sp. EFPC2]QSA96396.1 tetratricopeptide repeat protein [Methylococcus sp. EFPC2]